MNVILAKPVRVTLYLLTLLGTPVEAYLLANGYIGPTEHQLWSAEVVAVSALATFKAVSPDPEPPADDEFVDDHDGGL